MRVIGIFMNFKLLLNYILIADVEESITHTDKLIYLVNANNSY